MRPQLQRLSLPNCNSDCIRNISTSVGTTLPSRRLSGCHQLNGSYTSSTMFDNARLQMQNYPARNSSSQSSRAWLERQSKDPYVQKAQELGLPSRAYFKLQEINEQHYSASVNKKSKKNKSTSSSNRRMIQPNMLVLDLGAAPGGWSLYVSTEIDPTLGGGIVAVDLLPLNLDISTRIEDNVGGRFEFVQGDFTQNKIRLEVMDRFARLSKETQSTEDGQRDLSTQRKANLIVSDMAANFLGDSKTDAIRTINLCEQALSFAAGDGCFDSSYSPKEDQGMLLKDGSFLCKYFSCGKDNEQELMDAAKRVFKSVHSFKPKASRKESSEMYLLGYSKL